MIRTRLARLEKLAAVAAASCPACAHRPWIILVPGDREPTDPPPPCKACGRQLPRQMVRFTTPLTTLLETELGEPVGLDFLDRFGLEELERLVAPAQEGRA